MRTLLVHLNDQQVGTLSEGEDLWSFEYAPEWTKDPESFDLAPGLPRSKQLHQDGGTLRPVQWYFDNLLPEETLREAVIKEASLKGDDAFALLQYLGRESAGSLVLLAPDEPISLTGGLQRLSDEVLSQRIRNHPRISLSSGAPKRMSVAGAQHKLLVVYRDKNLYEPVGAEPSTHLLKPNHTSADYPSSVINEYLMQLLARKLGLKPPAVFRRYVPEPVYLIERFDRYADAQGRTQRLHIIDACQLLNKSRNFKSTAATVATLAECVKACRNRARARTRLFCWLAFNVLIGNDDNHLKNISFTVSNEGIDVSPPYDMLCTAVYHTRACAQDRARWPDVPLMIPLPGAGTFGEVTYEAMMSAGEVLGLSRRSCERELDRIVKALPIALDQLIGDLERENVDLPESARVYFGGELRLVRTIRHVVAADMLLLLARPVPT